MRVLPEIDTFIKTAIATNRPVPVTILREKTVYDYPKWPIRELMMNAIMHRDYHSTGPTMFYQFADRIEILNSGCLYGRVNRDNFPDENDYRNPIIADAMRTLGYVNRFGRGIGRVKVELVDNGNGEPSFDTEQIGSFRVSVRLTKYAMEAGEATLPTESSQECGAKGAESSQRLAESSQVGGAKDEESSQRLGRVREWVNEVLSDGIRADARANMIHVITLIAQDSSVTAESMSKAIGITARGAQKILASLQKMGLVKHEGPNLGGHWELVGFEP